MTAASDAVAKAFWFEKLQAQSEYSKRFIDRKASVAKHLYGYDYSVMNSKCLVVEWKMIWQNMWRNYQKGFYQQRRLGRSLPLKPSKVTLFIMILCNSENSIDNSIQWSREIYAKTVNLNLCNGLYIRFLEIRPFVRLPSLQQNVEWQLGLSPSRKKL